MDPREFGARLQSLIGRPTHLRPSVCDGSPLDCEVFIVELNPATPMSRAWWDFWSLDQGFRRAEWLEHYRQERHLETQKPGRTRRAPISNIRV
jgi:hypothetical protein